MYDIKKISLQTKRDTHIQESIWHVHHTKEAWRIYIWGGVATISRLLQIIGLFCKRAL